MAIQKGYKQNFETIKQSFKNNHVALVECKDAKTGEPVIVICAGRKDQTTDEVELIPLAKMVDGDPFDELIPPSP